MGSYLMAILELEVQEQVCAHITSTKFGICTRNSVQLSDLVRKSLHARIEGQAHWGPAVGVAGLCPGAPGAGVLVAVGRLAAGTGFLVRFSTIIPSKSCGKSTPGQSS
jgi:hypothetical protein